MSCERNESFGTAFSLNSFLLGSPCITWHLIARSNPDLQITVSDVSEEVMNKTIVFYYILCLFFGLCIGHETFFYLVLKDNPVKYSSYLRIVISSVLIKQHLDLQPKKSNYNHKTIKTYSSFVELHLIKQKWEGRKVLGL